MRRMKAGGVAVLTFLAGSMLAVAPAAADEVDVAAANFEFSPREIQVPEGTTVTWTNTDPEPHTVTADNSSFSLLINPGQSVSRTFNSPGEVPYFCKLHGAPGGLGMAGTIFVGDTEPPPTVNLAGADNVSRAIAWSQSTFPDGSGFALLGRADLFADSLASGGAQGKLDGPLLFTPTGALDARTKAELDRLGTSTVYVLGGTAAVSDGVVAELRAAGYAVSRVAGTDRLATAVAAAETFYPEARSALLVRAFADGGDPTRAFADALGAGAVAAATGQPVLFTETGRLSPATKAYLQSRPIDAVTVVGGTAAIADAVLDELDGIGVEADRVAGVNRTQTAAYLAEGVGDSGEVVLIDGTSADSWADGFAAASRRAPVLLTSGDVVTGATAQVLTFLFGHRLVCGATVSAVGCARAEVVAGLNTEFPELGAYMTGEAADGEDGAVGVSGLYVGSGGTTLCYDYFGTIGDFTASHIHRHVDSSIAVPMNLDVGVEDFFGCTYDVPAAILADVVANPGDYYVNIHTAEFPAGAMQGTVQNLTFIAFAAMLGESEIPGPGDPNGIGFGGLITTDTPGELCSFIFVDMLGSAPTAAHIHEGEIDQSGPPVLTLQTPTEDAFPFACYDAGESLIADIQADLDGYYMNVHTGQFPAGAIRGQLFTFF
ncbi:MAG TPA: cell wall-binding repeat-containing protein [Acidimicrobiales bacterium]|nr:cell wall-binding repeat-containing protein [Acidimicrobiales bacterium]